MPPSELCCTVTPPMGSAAAHGQGWGGTASPPQPHQNSQQTSPQLWIPLQLDGTRREMCSWADNQWLASCTTHYCVKNLACPWRGSHVRCVDTELNSSPTGAMPNPYLISTRARAPASLPAPCQNQELCLIPVIPWQMQPGVAILYSWEPEQNGWVCILGLHPGFPCWVPILGLHPGFLGWVCILGFHPGSPFWVCMVGFHPGFLG